jgi:hypothetical protein
VVIICKSVTLTRNPGRYYDPRHVPFSVLSAPSLDRPFHIPASSRAQVSAPTMDHRFHVLIRSIARRTPNLEANAGFQAGWHGSTSTDQSRIPSFVLRDDDAAGDCSEQAKDDDS